MKMKNLFRKNRKHSQTLSIPGSCSVFRIFAHDWKAIFRSKSVMIILAGLCFLPSLYAWINIYACWDPYANTGNLPVAIVNKDQGTVFNGKVVNVGSSVTEQLKNNKSIGWDFIDEWQGNYGLNEGKYYALIEIPENFSQRLVTLTTANPQKPALIYRVNEKLNSIATKITDAAESKLVNTIRTNFVQSVAEQVIDTLQSGMESADLNTSQIKELKSSFTQADSDITELKSYLGEANVNAQGVQNYLKDYIASLPKVSDQIGSLQRIADSNKLLIQKTQQTITSLSSDLNIDIQQMNNLDSQNQKLLTALEQANGNAGNIGQDTISVMEQSSNLCGSVDSILKSDNDQVSSLNTAYPSQSLSLLSDSLTLMDRLVVNEKTALDRQIPILRADTSKSAVGEALNSLSQLSSAVTKQIQTVSGSIQVNGTPVLNTLASGLTTEWDNAGRISQLGQSMIPQLSALASFVGAESGVSVTQVNQLNDMLTTFQSSLNALVSQIDGVIGPDMDQLIDLARNNPEGIADFLSSPIEVKQVDMYGAETFGVGLTPFYTVLAIWVGALLNCALLTVEYEVTENGVEPNLVQKHFGKMLLFLILSLIQSTIITLGDIFVLGVKPANLGLMLGISVLTSVTFTVIIFTLVSLFGNIGKAIAVVMMVFQIAGAGGIYPIQTNPKIFGILEPLWPFTYAINCFREAIAGPVWSSVLGNVRAMLIFLGAFLVLVIFKKPFHKLNTVLNRKYKEAQI